VANAAKEGQTDPKAKVRNRGKVIFPASSNKVKDSKDHFPINDANQARNALSRVSQYTSVPKWYSGTLNELQKVVCSAVKNAYSDIEVSMKKKSKSFRLMDYEEYQNLIKSEFFIMVTSPDPEDGHTHIVWVDKKGNGMTSPYPEEESYSRHQHVIVGKDVVPFTNGYSVSFHSGLQDATEADLKDSLSCGRRRDNNDGCREAAAGLVGRGIPDTQEQEADERISGYRRSLDKIIRDRLKNKKKKK